LVLSIGTFVGGQAIGNKTWDLGGDHEDGSSIVWNNSTHSLAIDMEVSRREDNITVAFGAVNYGDGDGVDTAIS
jgi:hypothetical protein